MNDADLEAERYELLEGAPYRFELPRRSFVGVLGAGLFVLWLPRRAPAQEGEGGESPPPADIAAWLHVGADNTVTVFTGKVEFGQDIRTSLAQVVAEELRAEVASIRLVMGDTDLVPFDMGTFGSRTTPAMAPQLRKVAAAARETLLDLAAVQWSLDRAELAAQDGRVVHAPSKRSAEFGALTKGQKLVKAVSDAPTTPAARWTVTGQSIPKVNGRDLVTGRHEFTSDVKRPGMLHGKVLRPPALGAALAAVDLGPAKGEGVVVVKDGEFVGVVAASARRAAKARDAIKAEWKPTQQPKAATLFADLKAKAQAAEGRRSHSAGQAGVAFAAAPRTLESRYTVAYIAHAPLEPRAAVAEWQDGKLTVWTGTQRPFGVREQLAEAFRLSPEKVRVIVPDTGAGYGGKHTGEAAIEAARLAKAAGKPVKLVWTREEEFAWAYFRPAGVIEVKSAAGADGRITAWEFHNYNSGGAAIRTPYDIPNQTIQFHASDSPWRQGSYRGLAATANHFARETHMDELAADLKKDPLELRRANLKDERLRAVLDAAAERFGWRGRKPAKNRGHGLAGGHEKGSYVATCAEVEVEPEGGRVRVRRLVAAFECGAILNPGHLESQVQGCLVQGLGGALFEAIDYEGGRVLNGRFSAYRLPRFSDTPEIEVVLLDRKDLPSVGAGETPIVAVAPAVGNAIFDATGVRLRALPLAPEGVPLGTPSTGAEQ
jgi:nicotinate dehydrogenase subunit B